MQQTAQRHHEILDDHQEEFNKLQVNIPRPAPELAGVTS